MLTITDYINALFELHRCQSKIDLVPILDRLSPRTYPLIQSWVQAGRNQSSLVESWIDEDPYLG